MVDGGALAEVSVDVYADTGRLEADFRNVREQSSKLDRDLQGIRQEFVGLSAATGKTEREFTALLRRLDPLHAAHVQFAKDLDVIERAQQAGIITLQEATALHQKATVAVNAHGKAVSQSAKYQEQATAQLKRWGAVAVAAAATATIALATTAIKNADALADQSKQLNIGVEDLQRWNFIAQRSGSDAATFAQGLEQLEQTMGKASAGSKRQSDLFDALGISLRTATGEAKTGAQILPELADALERVEDKNQRAAAAQILFGEAGNEMIQMLSGGSSRIDELSQAADNLGIVLSEDEIKNLDDTNQKLEDLKTVLSANIAGVVADNANAIVSLASALGTLVEWAAKAASAYVSFWDAVGRTTGKGVGAVANMAGGPNALRRGGVAAVQYGGVPGALLGAGLGWVADRMDGGQARGPAARPAAPAARPAGGAPIDLGNLLAPRGRTGRRPRDTSERDRLRALRNDKAFADELASFQSQILRDMAQQAKNADAKAAIELQILDIEHDRFERMLELEGPQGTKKYSAAEVELLRTKQAEVDSSKRALVERERLEQNLQDQNDLARTRLEADQEILEHDRDMARSSKARKQLDLELLDLQYELEQAALDAVLNSQESSDTEKQIAQERKRHLEILKGLDIERIEREYMGPVEKFFESVELTADQVDEALERIRAADLEDARNRAVQFADDVGGAFGDMVRQIVALEDPLDILTSLLQNLAATFTEEVLVRPVENFARQQIGGPLAERVTGAPAGPEGLWVRQLGETSLQTATQIDQMRLAASRFSQGVAPNVTLLGDATTESANAMAKAGSTAQQFGSGLMQILSTIGMGGGGAGGGLLNMGLGLLGSLAGGIGGGNPLARLVPSVNANIAANPGIFHEGGEIGPDGRPIRRLPVGEVDIRAKVGERVIARGPSRDFAPLLDSINAGRLPQLRGMGTQPAGRGGNSSVSVSIGDVVLSGAKDERGIRRAGRQAAGEIVGKIAKVAKTGIVKSDR